MDFETRLHNQKTAFFVNTSVHSQSKTSHGVLILVKSELASLSSIKVTLGCSWRKDAGATSLIGPSIVLATTLAL